MRVALEDLRRFAVSRSLFPASTLQGAIDRLGFVQADPIRAPARAQDLTLRHRVEGYCAGDLERAYPQLAVEEDVFVAYGFVPRSVHALMHPRVIRPAWSRSRRKRAELLLGFVRERGEAHPREVDDRFSHGRVTNYWGGSSNATTHLLEAMHYRGMLRVVRRERGIRIYGERQPAESPTNGDQQQLIDALVDVVVGKYAPLPGPSLSHLVSRLRYAAPQWHSELRSALQRAKQRLGHARVDGIDWYWPPDEQPRDIGSDERVRFLAPFDPVVWDRRRFELLWGWEYRFEAYTPVRKRKLGYYALPLLRRDRVIGWANIASGDGGLQVEAGYVASRPPREGGFKREFDAEVDRVRAFLGPRSL